MKYIVLIMLVPCLCFAQTITSVSGTVAADEEIIISGSSFGTKATASPWMFDNFDNDATDGVDITARTTPIGGVEWLSGVSYDGRAFDDSLSHSGSFSAYQYDNTDGLWTMVNYVEGLGAQERYLSYWYRRYGSGGVWKMDRTGSNTYNNPPYDSPTASGWGSYAYVNNCTDFLQLTWGTDSGDADVWQYVEVYYELGTADNADGSYQVSIDGELREDRLDDLVTVTSNCVVEDPDAVRIDTWLTPILANNFSEMKTWLDDIYIDNTRARVVLGNASTFSNCTFFEPQIPTIWATDEITVDVNLGGFIENDSAWLYVVTDAGDVSNGHAIIIGESGGGGDPTTDLGELTAEYE